MPVATSVEHDNAAFKIMDFCAAISLLDSVEPELEIDLNGVKVVKTVDEDGKPIVLVIDQMHADGETSAAIYC